MDEEIQNQFLSGCLLKLINCIHTMVMIQVTNTSRITYYYDCHFEYNYYLESRRKQGEVSKIGVNKEKAMSLWFKMETRGQ